MCSESCATAPLAILCRRFAVQPRKEAKANIRTTDSMGDVPRTDAHWNKLACPREPTGSLSEAIYSPRTSSKQASISTPPSMGRTCPAQSHSSTQVPAGSLDRFGYNISRLKQARPHTKHKLNHDAKALCQNEREGRYGRCVARFTKTGRGSQGCRAA